MKRRKPYKRSQAPMNKRQREGALAEKFALLTLYRQEWTQYMLAGEPWRRGMKKGA